MFAYRRLLVTFALMALVDIATATVECKDSLFGYQRGNRRFLPDIPMPVGVRDFTLGPFANICEFGTVHEGTNIRACDDVTPTVEALSLTTGRVHRNSNLTEAGVIYVNLHCITPPSSG